MKHTIATIVLALGVTCVHAGEFSEEIGELTQTMSTATKQISVCRTDFKTAVPNTLPASCELARVHFRKVAAMQRVGGRNKAFLAEFRETPSAMSALDAYNKAMTKLNFLLQEQ